MKQELTERERKLFIQMPAVRAVLTLSVPTIISQVIAVIYNLADTYYVGRTGDPRMVAAITVCMPLMLLMAGMAGLFGIGGASLIARCLGVNDFVKARKVSAFSVWGGVTVVILYSLVLIIFREPVLRLLGAMDDMIDYAASYMFWVCVIGGIFTLLNPLLANLVRSEGAAREASIGVSMGGLLNMALDPLFMFVILPKGLEVTGAAVATLLSNVAASAYFVIYIIRRRKVSVLSLNPRDVAFTGRIPLDVITIGLPSFIMTMMGSVSSAVANNLMSPLGSAAISGMGIAKRTNMLSFRVSTGITQGTLPLIAFNHSAQNYKRMKSAITGAASIAVGFATLCMIVSLIFGHVFVRFFIDDADTIRYGSRFIRLVCSAMPLASISMTAMMLFQAAEKKVEAMFMSIMRKGILDIPLMVLFNHLWPLYGVAASTPIVEGLSAVVAVILAIVFFKKLFRSSGNASPDRESEQPSVPS